MGEKAISAAFPFESNFVEVNGEQIHYVEAGKGDPILFLHGNPTSAYLWRNIIPYTAQNGRAIAMDLIGMGKSSKPDIPYRFFDHVPFVEGFIEKLDLRNVTLVVHDWGSGLGFHYARRNEANVKALVFMEAILGPVEWSDFPAAWGLGFRMMRAPAVGWFLINVMNIFVNQVLPRATHRKLTKEEMRHYREPFATVKSRNPVRQWPCEIPIDGRPADVHEAAAAYHAWLQETEIPKLLFHAKPGGLITASTVDWCRANFKNLTTVDVGPGIHYLQEDNPHLIGEEIHSWISHL